MRFSLRDLLVGVTVICVAFALLMPVIQAAREASRRMSCSNDFKQIGLAIHNYHSAFKHLPSGMSGTEANEHRLSGLIALTPFLEASVRWETIMNPQTFGGVTFPSMGPVPWDTRYSPWCENVGTLRCPSDDKVGTSLGRTNYAFCVADQIIGLYDAPSKDGTRGMFAPGHYVRFRDTTDGLSNTIMMAEIGTEDGRSVRGQFSLGHSKTLADSPAKCVSQLDPREPEQFASDVTLSNLGRGGAYADGAGGYSLVHAILPPNAPSCAIGNQAPYEGVFSAGSYHLGGCHVLMGDGAVVFVTDSIEAGSAEKSSPRDISALTGSELRSPYGLWGALGTRAAEEIIEETLVY
ncbi:MAG: DUF1559 domain-containing protein [Planctomycetota bacterium]